MPLSARRWKERRHASVQRNRRAARPCRRQRDGGALLHARRPGLEHAVAKAAWMPPTRTQAHRRYRARTSKPERRALDTPPTKTAQLGKSGPSVFPIALGCMGMGAGSWYGDSDEAESIATIHAALERGVNLIDTGDFYGMGRNELLVGKALQGRRDQGLLSVKFGAPRAPPRALLGFDARPAATKSALAHSLSRLGVDYIDIYRPVRLDPNVPIEDTVGAIADMVKAGYVRHIGLSEVGVETIRRAAAVHPICDLQIEYSLVSRSPERAILRELAALGIATTAYGVLSRGLLTGSRPGGESDFRAHLPR